MQKKILLIEPGYKNKYPPLGLMKIATSHTLEGDEVTFCKGNDPKIRDQNWDLIYISTLFTFHWDATIKTIQYYLKTGRPIVLGGILATLMPIELERATGIYPHVGPFKKNSSVLMKAVTEDVNLRLIKSDIRARGIDSLPPHYGIFEGMELPYRYTIDSSYILRTTKGCTRDCEFCCVSRLEPEIVSNIKIGPLISYIANRWGERQNLLLLDDNILMSPTFNKNIDEIRDLGFEKGAKFNRKKRSVDFNQGLDLRLLAKKQLKKLSEIELRPLRLAFDDIKLQKSYERKILWAIDLGFREISSYLLYNYNDSPVDLYKRLLVASRINEKYGSRIYSFPMKYIPCMDKDRKHIGPKWTRRQIRGVQCILNATHGIAPTKSDFLKRAFGVTCKNFLRIIQMPENYIIYRKKYTRNGAIHEWVKIYNSLSPNQRREALLATSSGKGIKLPVSNSRKVNNLFSHYENESRP